MIGNKYLEEFYTFYDRDTAISQLLELLHVEDSAFIKSISEQHPNIDDCTQEELEFLTVISALLDYFMQLKNLNIPTWIRDPRLIFESPFYYSKRGSDFEKLKIMITSPGPFRRRNVYFDLNSLSRR